MRLEPEILQFANGSPVCTQQEWHVRRAEILRLFSEYEYGFTPKVCGAATCKTVERIHKCAGGHGVLDKIEVSFPTEKGTWSFPVNYFHPTAPGRHCTFILINFRPDAYDMYFPAEEILDNGFGVAQFYYEDITSDGPDLDGIAAEFHRVGNGTDWGKIGMWAFAASRLADVLLTMPETAQLAVIGHSRLGKTALWCAAQDERISFAFSNDSGCSGAAYEREKHPGAETIQDITKRFPFWFCENYLRFAENPNARAFDQHMLLSLAAPRFVGVGSASRDAWADPYSEQLSCAAAGEVWEKIYHTNGYIGKVSPADVGDCFSEGSVHYHLRDGIHFLSRRDWQAYMEFVQSKQSK